METVGYCPWCEDDETMHWTDCCETLKPACRVTVFRDNLGDLLAIECRPRCGCQEIL